MTEPTLVAFLRARLDETERRAQALAALRARWRTAGGWPETGSTQVVGDDGYLIVEDDTSWAAEIVTHIAHHDPARVLRDVQAKRRIIDAHPLASDPEQPAHCETCLYVADPTDPEPWPEAGYPCPTLRYLAEPYSDHPDFQERWRPS